MDDLIPRNDDIALDHLLLTPGGGVSIALMTHVVSLQSSRQIIPLRRYKECL